MSENAEKKYQSAIEHWKNGDRHQAKRLIEEAAEQGHALAQTSLGLLYWWDHSDIKKMIEWTKKAADQGNEWAQYNLGLVHLWPGLGQEDKQKAVYWLCKAAEQGNVAAQVLLGLAYLNDDEEKLKDKHAAYREAYIWFAIAKGNAHGEAIIRLRDTNWSEHLSDSGIASAQEEAGKRWKEINDRKAEKN